MQWLGAKDLEFVGPMFVDFKIKTRGKISRTLFHISPEQSLFDGLKVLHRYRIHRLPIMQKARENTVLCIVGQQRMLRFLLTKVSTYTLWTFKIPWLSGIFHKFITFDD